MRLVTLVVVFVLSGDNAWAGPIASQFNAGYDGIDWGMPLARLVGALPGGDHYFSTAPGERVYSVINNEPLFGVPRAGMRVQYHMGLDGGVEDIAVAVPFERREQLLGALMSQFGAYSRVIPKGMANIYIWPRDGRLVMAVRASRDPTNGILEFWIARPLPAKDGAAVPK